MGKTTEVNRTLTKQPTMKEIITTAFDRLDNRDLDNGNLDATRDYLIDALHHIEDQCEAYRQGINFIVKTASDEKNHREADIVSDTCKIEVGIDNAIDSINHVINSIDEGMTLNVQAGILSGAIALLQQQIRLLCEMRTTK